MIRRPAKASKTLENASGDVGGRGIDHGVVIGKRNIAEEPTIVVAIECSPTTIAILHTQEPLNTTASCGFHALSIGELHALQSHQDESGVVHVRIKIVAKFEGPATGLGVFVFYLPIAGAENLFGQNPVSGLDQRGVVGSYAGFFEGDHGDGSVPDGGNAGLQANGFFVFDLEAG